MARSQSQSGFTLIEVMIAITVFAVISAAISNTISQSVSNVLYLEQKTLASFVAENQMNLLRTEAFPNVGDRNDTVEMAGREWRVNYKVENTAVPDTRRITISVADNSDKDANLISLVGITGKY